ncbi:XRE family transcriptional regulator [Metakosakonia massiliensis]|uniref:HTH cro/C1-type domain-containing protein n=1 Tax=Phytobacter massiliensis TaxID=1485952 RepID=A0A6N3HBJ3_9ENTR
MTRTIDTKIRHVTRAGDNIFAELGFDESEAARLQAQSREEMEKADELKRQLMVEIAGWIKDCGYKQLEAAKILHVSRPRVSDVVNQKTEKFTLDTLVGMATVIGKRVELIIS